MMSQPSLYSKQLPLRRAASARRTVELFFVAGAFFAAFAGCSKPLENEVVVYATIDQENSAPIFASFHRSVDRQVKPSVQFERRSSETASRIEKWITGQEPTNADLVWNDEVLQTIRLQKLGLLKQHSWRLEPGYPADMRAKDGSWCGFAARARVLLVNTEKLASREDYPRKVDDLSSPRWKKDCGLARPLVGPGATHAAVIRFIKGDEAAYQWFHSVSENVIVYPTDQAVATAVALGKIAWGLTNSDEAIYQRDDGRPVAIVFPDQATDAPGALRVPNTIAVLNGARNPVAAARLADFLLTPHTEDRLAMGNSAQLPLSRLAKERPRVLTGETVRWITVDFEEAANDWETFAAKLEKLFP